MVTIPVLDINNSLIAIPSHQTGRIVCSENQRAFITVNPHTHVLCLRVLLTEDNKICLSFNDPLDVWSHNPQQELSLTLHERSDQFPSAQDRNRLIQEIEEHRICVNQIARTGLDPTDVYKHPRNRTQQGQEQESSQDSSSHSRPTVYANSPTPTGHTTGTRAANPNPSADASKTGALLLQRDQISPSLSPLCDLNHQPKPNKTGFFSNRKPSSSSSTCFSLGTLSGGSKSRPSTGSIRHNKHKPRPTRVFLPVKRGRADYSLSHHD